MTIRRSARSTADRSPRVSGRLAAEAARSAARQNDGQDGGASLHPSGHPSRGKARARAVPRGKAHAIEDPTLSGGGFGRATSRACPPGQAPEARRRKASRFQDQLQAGNGKRMKSTACSARGRKARPSWLRRVVDRTDAREGVTKSSHRGTCNCGGGRRTRPAVVSGLPECPCGAWAARVEALGVSAVAWMRLVPGIRRDRGDASSSSRGKTATTRVSGSLRGGGSAHRPSCSHDKDFRHGRPVLTDGRDGGFDGHGAE